MGLGVRESFERGASRRRARGAFAVALVALAVVLFLAASAAAAPPAASAGATGVVRGVVVLGPLTTGERGSGLSWPAVKAVVRIFRHGRDEAVRTLRTGADGRFAVRLKAGTYRLTAEPAGPSTLPIPHDVTTRVRAGQTRQVRLWLDTGLQLPDASDAGQSVEATRTPPGQGPRTQGVVGVTRRGPIVPFVKPDEPSDEACGATLTFYREDGRRVARITSAEEAGFLRALPAGTYVVSAVSAVSTFDRAGPFMIKVPREQWLSLTVWFDTGIRFVGGVSSPGRTRP